MFKLSPGGTETVLYSFCSLPNCSDGSGPLAGLIADSSGNLYGTTANGGGTGSGMVFKLSPGGTETVLYTFCNVAFCKDGLVPGFGHLIADSKGNLYGTTDLGGAFDGGVVFKLGTVLYSFCNLIPGCSDGRDPEAGLIADSSGNLYGTTEGGGASGNGVVFRLTPGGTETVLYSFKGGISDGRIPAAGLIADSSGNLYGTTINGGAMPARCSS